MCPQKVMPFSSSVAASSMVNNVFRPNRLGDEILLKAFESVSKEPFTSRPSTAYTLDVIDEELPPYSLAKALQFLSLTKEDVLTYVGFEKGYGLYVSSLVASKVYGIDTKKNIEALNEHEDTLPSNLQLIEKDDFSTLEIPKDTTVLLIAKSVKELPFSWISSLEKGQKVAFFKTIGNNLAKLCIGIKTDFFKISEKEDLPAPVLRLDKETPFIF